MDATARALQGDDGMINCDKDGHYIGYVANFTCVCDEWEMTE